MITSITPPAAPSTSRSLMAFRGLDKVCETTGQARRRCDNPLRFWWQLQHHDGRDHRDDFDTSIKGHVYIISEATS